MTVDQKIESVTRWPVAPPPVVKLTAGPPPVVVPSLRKRRPSRVTLSAAVTDGMADDRRLAGAGGRVAAADSDVGLGAEDP